MYLLFIRVNKETFQLRPTREWGEHVDPVIAQVSYAVKTAINFPAYLKLNDKVLVDNEGAQMGAEKLINDVVSHALSHPKSMFWEIISFPFGGTSVENILYSDVQSWMDKLLQKNKAKATLENEVAKAIKRMRYRMVPVTKTVNGLRYTLAR